MEKLLCPTLTGTWRPNIQLNKYAKVIQEDTKGNPFLNPNLFGEWINLLHRTLEVDYSWGGWMEDREELLEGTYLPKGGKVHLGIDFWVPVNTCVHLPKTGKLVQSRHDSDQMGGWGGQAIFEIDGLYLIFGHLKDTTRRLGSKYDKGEIVGHIAEIEKNGGWYPHLHLQCMKNFDPDVDGYGFPVNYRFDSFPNPIVYFEDTSNN